MTLENFIRERADVLASQAERYPATAHVAQSWIVNALRWAGLRNDVALERHLNRRIARLSRIRRERLTPATISAFAA